MKDGDTNEFFRQATLRICGSLNIETALGRTFEYLRTIMPIDEIGLFLYDPGLNVFHRIAGIKSHPGHHFSPVSPMPEGSRREWSSIWAEMDSIKIINEPFNHPQIREAAGMHGIDLNISMISMRLEMEGQRVGLLLVRTEGEGRYDALHAERLLLLHEPFAVAMSNALQHQELVRLKDMLVDDNRYLRGQIREQARSEIIGADLGLRNVMEMVRQVARLDSPVLLLGETGVGKGVIANAIHYASKRRNGPFVSVNCGAITESLFDSELFGHEKGAFTGAVSLKKGRFERADKGTIFLDEIGELPPHAQVRLLHVFQDRIIERVGGTETISVDVRMISATNRNLEEMVRQGKFREDLWFRLNVFPIHIPPLRQRKEDIQALVHHFIETKSVDLKLGEKPRLAEATLDRLQAYAWPGNVRELENVVERELIRNPSGPLRFDDLLGQDVRFTPRIGKADPDDRIMPLDELNAIHIRRALKISGGKINGPGGAAELLDIHPNTLRKRMEKLGIAYKRRNSAVS